MYNCACYDNYTCSYCRHLQNQENKHKFVKRLYVEGINQNMINIFTSKGEMRIIFKEDGSFRIITDLPCEQVQDILKENKDFGNYQLVNKIERFGYPED